MIIPGNLSRVLLEMKGDKVRWSLVGHDDALGYRVYDAAARRLFTVDLSTPSVGESDLTPPPTGAPGGAAHWTFTSVGQGTVGGYPCERLRATSGGSTYDVLAARGMATVPLPYAMPAAGPALPFLDALEELGELPLSASKVEVADGGKEVFTPKLLTTQVRPGPVDGARFALPNVPVTRVNRLALPTGPRLR